MLHSQIRFKCLPCVGAVSACQEQPGLAAAPAMGRVEQIIPHLFGRDDGMIGVRDAQVWVAPIRAVGPYTILAPLILARLDYAVRQLAVSPDHQAVQATSPKYNPGPRSVANIDFGLRRARSSYFPVKESRRGKTSQTLSGRVPVTPYSRRLAGGRVERVSTAG